MTRLWPIEADPYYWLTAQLAARGLQRLARRLIAANIMVFGLIPILLAFGPGHGQNFPGQVVAVAVTVCCVAMGSQWLWRVWPSRGVSRACVLVGAACVSLASMAAGDPLLGLLFCASIGTLTIYVGLFHSLPMLVATWVIWAAGLLVVVERLAAVSITRAVGGTLLIVMINAFAAFITRVLLQLVRVDIPDHHLEPLTGLLTRDGFYEHVATLLGARNREDDRYLVVAVLHIDSFSMVTSLRGAAQANEVLVSLAQRVRETARREALIAYQGDAEFFVADLFMAADPTPLSGRLRLAISTAPGGMTASVGVVSTPLRKLITQPPYDVLEELLAIATSAMYEARAAGGNQTRHAINPALSVLNDSESPDTNAAGRCDTDGMA